MMRRLGEWVLSALVGAVLFVVLTSVPLYLLMLAAFLPFAFTTFFLYALAVATIKAWRR